MDRLEGHPPRSSRTSGTSATPARPGQITLKWTPSYWTTGYEFDCDTFDANVAYDPSYTRCATLTDQDDTASEHSVVLTSWTVGTTTYSIDDTKSYDLRICSTHAMARDCWLAPIMNAIPTVAASNVSTSTATMTLHNHTGSCGTSTGS